MQKKISFISRNMRSCDRDDLSLIYYDFSYPIDENYQTDCYYIELDPNERNKRFSLNTIFGEIQYEIRCYLNQVHIDMFYPANLDQEKLIQCSSFVERNIVGFNISPFMTNSVNQ